MTANDRMLLKEIAGIQFTNIEREIIRVMSDGNAYTLAQLKTYDKEVDENTIRSHIHNIRKKINCSHYRIYSGYEGGKLIYRIMHTLILN